MKSLEDKTIHNINLTELPNLDIMREVVSKISDKLSDSYSSLK